MTTPEPELTYEAARDALVDVVRRLEAGDVSLSESMTLWERGERLAALCERWLAGARERVAQSRASTPEPYENRPSAT